jgi:hypothetical protein
MADLTAIRAGLKANLETIPNLRASANIPDMPNPPQAIVALNRIGYDVANAKGAAQYDFVVTVIVGRQSERTAQTSLDEYISTTHARSIKNAIQSDRTLAGSAYDVRAIEMTGLNVVSIGEVNYLSADFSVTVYSS